jgi:hypothetical protein
VQNAKARVYRTTPHPKTLRGFRVWGCTFSVGVPLSLDDGDYVFTFLPPALSLRGATLGTAADVCDFSAGGNGCTTSVGVWDLTKLDTDPGYIVSGADAGPLPNTTYKVGSLRHRSNGDIAWIECPETTIQSEVTADRGPSCVRRGSFDRVYKLDSRTRKRRVLDRGHDIDPSSLRLSGQTLSWRAGRRTRHATLR